MTLHKQRRPQAIPSTQAPGCECGGGCGCGWPAVPVPWLWPVPVAVAVACDISLSRLQTWEPITVICGN